MKISLMNKTMLGMLTTTLLIGCAEMGDVDRSNDYRIFPEVGTPIKVYENDKTLLTTRLPKPKLGSYADPSDTSYNLTVKDNFAWSYDKKDFTDLDNLPETAHLTNRVYSGNIYIKSHITSKEYNQIQARFDHYTNSDYSKPSEMYWRKSYIDLYKKALQGKTSLKTAQKKYIQSMYPNSKNLVYRARVVDGMQCMETEGVFEKKEFITTRCPFFRANDMFVIIEVLLFNADNSELDDVMPVNKVAYNEILDNLKFANNLTQSPR